MRVFYLIIFFLTALPCIAGPTGIPADLPNGMKRLAEGLVRQTLGAPQTARFRKMGAYQLSDGGWAVCGEVNSRNLTGLMMGWKPIFIRFRVENRQLVLARRIVDWPADVACRQLAMGRQLRTRN